MYIQVKTSRDFNLQFEIESTQIADVLHYHC